MRSEMQRLALTGHLVSGDPPQRCPTCRRQRGMRSEMQRLALTGHLVSGDPPQRCPACRRQRGMRSEMQRLSLTGHLVSGDPPPYQRNSISCTEAAFGGGLLGKPAMPRLPQAKGHAFMNATARPHRTSGQRRPAAAMPRLPQAKGHAFRNATAFPHRSSRQRRPAAAAPRNAAPIRPASFPSLAMTISVFLGEFLV